jgi:hypothetical protein
MLISSWDTVNPLSRGGGVCLLNGVVSERLFGIIVIQQRFLKSINTSTSMLYLPVRSNFCSVCQHQLDSLITILVKQTKNLNYYLKGSVHMSQVYTIFIKI